MDSGKLGVDSLLNESTEDAERLSAFADKPINSWNRSNTDAQVRPIPYCLLKELSRGSSDDIHMGD